MRKANLTDFNKRLESAGLIVSNYRARVPADWFARITGSKITPHQTRGVVSVIGPRVSIGPVGTNAARELGAAVNSLEIDTLSGQVRSRKPANMYSGTLAAALEQALTDWTWDQSGTKNDPAAAPESAKNTPPDLDPRIVFASAGTPEEMGAQGVDDCGDEYGSESGDEELDPVDYGGRLTLLPPRTDIQDDGDRLFWADCDSDGTAVARLAAVVSQYDSPEDLEQELGANILNSPAVARLKLTRSDLLDVWRVRKSGREKAEQVDPDGVRRAIKQRSYERRALSPITTIAPGGCPPEPAAEPAPAETTAAKQAAQGSTAEPAPAETTAAKQAAQGSTAEPAPAALEPDYTPAPFGPITHKRTNAPEWTPPDDWREILFEYWIRARGTDRFEDLRTENAPVPISRKAFGLAREYAQNPEKMNRKQAFSLFVAECLQRNLQDIERQRIILGLQSSFWTNALNKEAENREN